MRLPDGSYLVAGRLWIEELNEALDWDLPTKKDYETVAGSVLASLGRIPRPGEQVRPSATTSSRWWTPTSVASSR